MGLPDAKSRLSYIARLTGQAAEKVLNQVDQAKAQHDHIAAETRRIGELIVKDPVAAVAKGHVMNFITDVEQASKKVDDDHLTKSLMAQDFHDLTGQVIAVVHWLPSKSNSVLLLLQASAGYKSLHPVQNTSPYVGWACGRRSDQSRSSHGPVPGR